MSVEEAEWQHKSGLILGTLFIQPLLLFGFCLDLLCLVYLHFAIGVCLFLVPAHFNPRFCFLNLFPWFLSSNQPFPGVLTWDLRTNWCSQFFCLGIAPSPLFSRESLPLSVVTFLVCLLFANCWRWRLWSHSLSNKAPIKLKKTELFVGFYWNLPRIKRIYCPLVIQRFLIHIAVQ